MKTILKFKRVKHVFAIVLAITVIGACEKPIEPDYREKWVGTYECEKKQIFSVFKDTFVSYPLVDVVAVRDIAINITERGTSSDAMFDVHHDVNVNSDGSFDFRGRTSFSGNFHTDSLFLELYDYTLGLRGHSYYTGKKLKSGKQ